MFLELGVLGLWEALSELGFGRWEFGIDIVFPVVILLYKLHIIAATLLWQGEQRERK